MSVTQNHYVRLLFVLLSLSLAATSCGSESTSSLLRDDGAKKDKKPILEKSLIKNTDKSIKIDFSLYDYEKSIDQVRMVSPPVYVDFMQSLLSVAKEFPIVKKEVNVDGKIINPSAFNSDRNRQNTFARSYLALAFHKVASNISTMWLTVTWTPTHQLFLAHNVQKKFRHIPVKIDPMVAYSKLNDDIWLRWLGGNDRVVRAVIHSLLAVAQGAYKNVYDKKAAAELRPWSQTLGSILAKEGKIVRQEQLPRVLDLLNNSPTLLKQFEEKEHFSGFLELTHFARQYIEIYQKEVM